MNRPIAHAQFKGQLNIKMASGGGFVNPEYYDHYDHVGSLPIDDYADPLTKKRKLMNMSVCVDHLRGYCPKGPRCNKAHTDRVISLDERETMAKAKFCHDFQNRGICSRGTCRFLHVTRREEDEFLLTGVIPATVFDRAEDQSSNSSQFRYTSFSSEVRGGRGSGRGGGRGAVRGRGGGGGYGMGGGGGPSRGFNPYPPYQQSFDYGGGGGGGGGGPYPYDYNNWREWDIPQNRQGNSRYGHHSQNRGVTQALTYSNYCVDFLKRTCMKGSNCRLIHVDIVEDMDDREAIVKNLFCHDFQNKRCPRQYCKYIHANFDEQKVFVEQGYFSDSLCSRNMSKMFFCDICIDFLRSQCTRGSNCQYRHVACVEEKDERICLTRSLFCHDHQETVCHRPSCKLLHTSKEDEDYFLQTGLLPTHLHGDKAGGAPVDSALKAIKDNVCRDYVKGICGRGSTCKFYHPSEEEIKQIVSYQSNKGVPGQTPFFNSSNKGIPGQTPFFNSPGYSSSGPGNFGGVSNEEYDKVKKENSDLKDRVQQLERLLADACHCITLAVGDSNPAVQTLLQSLAGMAPESSLASIKTEQPNQD